MNATETKDRILTAALAHIPFDGWSMEVLRQGAADAGFDADIADVYFPRGSIDAIAWHSTQADQAMVDALSRLPLTEMRVPQKVKAALLFRLRAQLPNREAVRKALAVLSFPIHGIESLKLLYATVDAVWSGIGDASHDFNWYTKRMTLAGVYSATLLFWLNDESENLTDTEAFLDRRLQNVYQIGQAKKRCTEFFKIFIPAKAGI